MKKILICIYLSMSVFLICILEVNCHINYIQDEDDEYTWINLEFNTMDEVNSYIEWLYGTSPQFYYTTEHCYALLATQNIHQNTLRDDYNRLGSMKHDLNHDGIINSFDEIGWNYIENEEGGICQPTALTMALRYMVMSGYLSYTPLLNNNINDPMNIFYNVVDAYIYYNWPGWGGARENCYIYLNKMFEDYFDNNNYYAAYTTTNYVNILSNAYNNNLPAIAHITSGNGKGHAMTIAGYYIKHVHYLDDSYPGEEWEYPEVNLDLCFVAVNNGILDTLDEWANVNGELPPLLYERNYSFFNVNQLSGITYITL